MQCQCCVDISLLEETYLENKLEGDSDIEYHIEMNRIVEEISSMHHEECYIL